MWNECQARPGATGVTGSELSLEKRFRLARSESAGSSESPGVPFLFGVPVLSGPKTP